MTTTLDAMINTHFGKVPDIAENICFAENIGVAPEERDCQEKNVQNMFRQPVFSYSIADLLATTSGGYTA